MKRARLSGFTDESLPDLADLLPRGFDVEWLGQAMGRYRASELARTTMPTREEELLYLEQAAKTLRAARDLFAHGGLPPHGDATAHALALKLGADWPALRRRLRADLNQALSLIALSTERMEQSPGRRGRPAAYARNELLRELIRRLRATPMCATEAHALAEQILLRCRVPVPRADADSGLRAMQRAAAVKRQK